MEDADAATVVVGLVASPGPAAEMAQTLVDGLADQMGDRLPGAKWTIRVVADRLVDGPAPLHQLVSCTRRRLLDGGWQLAVFLTDLPLQTARRPVVAHASSAHGVAVISLPALGAVGVQRRAGEAIVRLVAVLVGDGDTPVDVKPARANGGRRRDALLRRLRELGTVAGDDRGAGVVAGVVSGNLRLLVGMLRANRPWRLAVGLSRALVAALAAGVFALVTNDVWQLADTFGWVRQTLVGAGSVAAVVLTLLLGADLWERAPPRPTDREVARSTREQVILLNSVTVTTLLIGVFALYCALFVITLLGVLLLVPPGLHASTLGHPIGFSDQVELACLASALATLGGALGAGLESDETVREAAYAYQPDRSLTD
ncbi:hypothetical protein RB614_07830 [Phytohabitans sp. ZYX-F-186]|uniref:Uncharacterized protein n=1 Tax=Phytohabitans maris TaxID=3071409 RepID=A0ABU0ZEQ5_9ACTN|nr:hypothetical protein [Phytohabitans sp. ZYX-F-186]MDQ7904432.1 hypothetical protein [Phytohabitans sp. ZYX-F-186]